jgi:hypothetical protein
VALVDSKDPQAKPLPIAKMMVHHFLYWGQTRGSYSVKPTVKGTYKLVCLVHPTTMAQTLEVK